MRSTAAAVVAPLITTVIDNGFGNAIVTFNHAVTWNASDAGSFQINGSAGSWQVQLSPTSLEYSPGAPFIAGDPWDWASADTSLAPTPNAGQTGNVT